jgi:protein-S-isoprenylcysteine O-methyltransferase Ste14
MDSVSRRAIRGVVVGNVVFFAMIFIPAWTLDYWQGWVFFLMLAVSTALVTAYLARYDRPLLDSRLRAGPVAEKTPAQKVIVTVGLPIYIVTLVLIVLDHRFHWSPAVPPYLSLLGDGLGALGLFIYFLVVKENRYAAATIHVAQGQTVVSSGPYAVVRHPMYTGAILVFLGAPLALGSWWGLLTVPLCVAWFVWRLLAEEQYLHENLPGYSEYAREVRYRLLPGVW